MQLNRYLVEVVINGIDLLEDPQAKQEFDYEISMRSHIYSHVSRWGENKNNLFIKIEIDSTDEITALRQTSEEIFEISNAVLNSIEGVNIHQVKVEFISS
jgi:hypothetical protein